MLKFGLPVLVSIHRSVWCLAALCSRWWVGNRAAILRKHPVRAVLATEGTADPFAGSRGGHRILLCEGHRPPRKTFGHGFCLLFCFYIYKYIYLKYPLYNAECVYVCLCLIVQYWKGIQQQKILRTLTFYGQLYFKKENNEKISLWTSLSVT